MAGGWTTDGNIQEQIEDTVTDGVAAARARMPAGPGTLYCDDCDEEIPLARRTALPGVRTCVSCQAKRDRTRPASGFNRRASKDSQLR